MSKSLLLISLVIIGLVFISEVDGIRWRRHSRNDEFARRLVVIKNDHRFEIRAIRKAVDTKEIDAIQFVMDTNWVPRYVMRYFSKDSDSADLIAGRWALWKIVEYVDNTTTAGFDPDVDQIVSSYKLWLRRFTVMDASQTIQADGSTLHSVCTDLDPIDTITPHPNVKLCANIADKRTVLQNGVHVDPNAIKWSLSISNYPYTVPNSRLAIKVSFDSRQVISEDTSDVNDDSTADDAITIADEQGNKGIASWIKTVTVTGTSCSPSANVVRSVIREGEFTRDVDVDFPARNDTDNLQITRTVRVSYFSFATDCQPDSITWDPDFGISEDDSAGAALLPSLLLIAAILSFLQYLM